VNAEFLAQRFPNSTFDIIDPGHHPLIGGRTAVAAQQDPVKEDNRLHRRQLCQHVDIDIAEQVGGECRPRSGECPLSRQRAKSRGGDRRRAAPDAVVRPHNPV
jgi:hypothetical protein